MTYFKRDPEKVKRAVKELENSNGDFPEINWWKPKEGENVIRILPPWNERGEMYLTVLQHWVDGTGVTCRKTIHPNENCYACDIVKSSGNEEWGIKKRVYFNILDMNDIVKGVQIWGSPVTLAGEILHLDTSDDYGDVSNPEKGFTLVITRKGKDLGTKYSVIPKREPSAIPDMKVLSNLYTLDVIFSPLSYEKMEERLTKTEEVSEQTQEAATGEAVPPKPKRFTGAPFNLGEAVKSRKGV